MVLPVSFVYHFQILSEIYLVVKPGDVVVLSDQFPIGIIDSGEYDWYSLQ